MKQLFAAIARRLAPRTFEGLADLAQARAAQGNVADSLQHLYATLDRQQAGIEELKRDLERLTAELDEMREDGRHVAELYDIVFSRLREDT